MRLITLSWLCVHQQVGVVLFDNRGHAIQIEDEMCFNEGVAYASTQNKAKIRNVLQNIGTPCSNSRSCALRSTSRYSAGLWKAFDLLRAGARPRESTPVTSVYMT